MAEPDATTLAYTVIFKASNNLCTISHKLKMEEKRRNEKSLAKKKKGGTKKVSSEVETSDSEEEPLLSTKLRESPPKRARFNKTRF